MHRHRPFLMLCAPYKGILLSVTGYMGASPCARVFRPYVMNVTMRPHIKMVKKVVRIQSFGNFSYICQGKCTIKL